MCWAPHKKPSPPPSHPNTSSRPPAPRGIVRHIQAARQRCPSHQRAAPGRLVLLAARCCAQAGEPGAGARQPVDGRVQQLGEEGGEAELVREVAPAGTGEGKH